MSSKSQNVNPSIRLLSWNTAGRVAKHAVQVEYIKSVQPDIIAIQEATARTIPMWRRAAANELSLPHFIDSRSLAPDQSILTGPRRYAQVFASRYPLRSLSPGSFPVPWQERVLSVSVRAPFGPIEAHTTHIPPGSVHKWLKIEMFEGIHHRLTRRCRGHRLLCGDFNMPRRELEDGTVLYWGTAERADGTLRRVRPLRWSAGERSVREGLAPFDLADAYRALHPPVERVETWIPSQGPNSNPRRFDHLYASKSLGVHQCDYDHQPRIDGLSDHSVLIADMMPSD